MSYELKSLYNEAVTYVNENCDDDDVLLSATRSSCIQVKEKNKSKIKMEEQKDLSNVTSPTFSSDMTTDGEGPQLPKCLRLESKNSSNDTLSLQLSIVREIEQDPNDSEIESNNVIDPSVIDPVGSESPRKNFMDLFEIIQTLGEGMSSCVFKVKHISNGQIYALKRLQRAQAQTDVLFFAECNFLSALKSQGVIKIISAFADNEYFYMLTELGVTDLFKKIKKSGNISEKIAKVVIRNLLKTLKDLHSNNIAHRDIKAENIVFTENSNFPKLIDFGDAVVVDDTKTYSDFVGTQCYLAPERWRKHFGWEIKASDIWAVGVLTYEMVTGKRCFYASSDRHLEEKIGRAAFKYPSAMKPSPLCCHFISSLLTVNGANRPTAELALRHPWLSFSESPEVQRMLIRSWNRNVSKRVSWTVYVPQ